MKQFVVTKHAVERTVERLGIATENAKNHLVNIMQTAYFNGSTPHPDGRMRKVYDHHRTRTRVIVSEDNKTIITVYKVPERLTLPKFMRPIIDREQRKLSREVTRNVRKHELAIAELTVDKGERMLAYAKAKNPKTREIIQRDIDAFQANIDGHLAAITREHDRLDNFVRATGVYA